MSQNIAFLIQLHMFHFGGILIFYPDYINQNIMH